MAGGKSDALEAAQLNEALGGTAYTAVTDTFIALYSASPTDASAGTELTGNGYARVQKANNTTNWPAGNPKSNGTAITFPTATGSNWARAYSWQILDASSAGNRLYWGPLAQNFKMGSVDATDVTNNTITSPGHGYANDTIVRVFSYELGALPTGLAVDTQYWVVGTATNTFQLAASQGGAAIDITATGSGFLEIGEDKSIVVAVGGAASFAIGALTVTED